MAQLLTLKWPKRGPVINSTAHIYIYIYIYVFLSEVSGGGPRVGFFNWQCQEGGGFSQERGGRCLRGISGKGGGDMGKMGSICHFPRALPASIWGHCSPVVVFTSIWGAHKRGVTMTLFVLFFKAYGYVGTPKHCKTRENAKWQIDPLLPPQGGGG